MDIILTQYSGAILGPIAKLLGWVMNGIYIVLDKIGIQDIGLTIIILTMIIYLCMLPLTIKQQKFSKLSQKMQPELQAIQKKYKDKTGKRLFNFYQYYVDEKGFNKAINYGLKEIGRLLEIDDLEYYAARHSWATIALNKVGIDKYTVHAALNHVDETMRVTDIYIERDFANENRANAKVVKYVFGRM